MVTTRFGIVGTGFIAGVSARAIQQAEGIRLTAVASRSLQNATRFAAAHPGTAAVAGWPALIAREDVDALYIATPTASKHEIARAAIAAGKHVLVDKPFAASASLDELIGAAADRGVVFMDATHFVHHPRTAAIRSAGTDAIGTPRSLHTTFYFPFSARDNIRFDTALEPMGALGDMAWYSMRAVVEYLRPDAPLARVAAAAERDPDTGAVIRASGFLAFADGKTSTFDVGYTAETAVMDLTLVGSRGVLSMDDFVLDWHDSFAFHHPDILAGYTLRRGMATRASYERIDTPARAPQEVLMLERFAALTTRPGAERAAFARASRDTQRHLDAVCTALAAS